MKEFYITYVKIIPFSGKNFVDMERGKEGEYWNMHKIENFW